jgi:post-segregation antitoxin (ccd killing protein)
MTTIHISLPDQLVHDARELGLLDSATLAELLQNEIRRRTFTDILAVSRHLATESEPDQDPEPPPQRR